MKTDTILQHPKHVLEPNGLFKWEKLANIECYCGHQQNSHLDGLDVCLKDLCICENFAVDYKEKVSPARKSVPEKYERHFNKPIGPVGPPSSLFV